MEKYAVVETEITEEQRKEMQKRANNANTPPRCPLCHSLLSRISAGYHCPTHGTLPFESSKK